MIQGWAEGHCRPSPPNFITFNVWCSVQKPKEKKAVFFIILKWPTIAFYKAEFYFNKYYYYWLMWDKCKCFRPLLSSPGRVFLFLIQGKMFNCKSQVRGRSIFNRLCRFPSCNRKSFQIQKLTFLRASNNLSMKESITVCELYTVHGIFTDCTIRFSLTATTHSRCVQMHQKESFNTRYRLFFFVVFF